MDRIFLQAAAAVDWKACPIVEIDPDKVAGNPVVKGTRIPAQGIE
jgi:uncharacterized protein (DUF433 family)